MTEESNHQFGRSDPAHHWDALYRSTEGKLPWEVDGTPREFETWASLLGVGASVLDLGCGRGHHAIAMAEFGFTVLGIDFSPAAIQAAIRNAEIGKVRNIMFKASDILNFRPEQPFDLVYDYSVFHHISRAGRQAYAKTASAAVRPGGFLALVCYSDGNPAEGFDADRQRTGKLGNTIFHLAFDEVMEIFNEDFRLSAYRESRLGPECTHHAHHFIFRRYQVAGSRVHQDTSASSGQRGSR